MEARVATVSRTGKSQSPSMKEFNERARIVSERTGAVPKPNLSARTNTRRSFKSGPRPAAEAEPSTEAPEAAAEPGTAD